MKTLDGKVALITGGLGAIGGATADLFAAEGARIAVADVEGPATPAAMSKSLYVFGADLADPGATRGVVPTVMKRYGRVDILVNCAGIGADRPFLETDEALFERMLRIHATAALALGQDAARDMAKRKSGAIVNVASISGMLGSKGRIAYGTAKAALIQMTRGMAVELAPVGIRVNAVAPGPVETPLSRRVHSRADRKAYTDRTPLGRYATPVEIARINLFLASAASSCVTGQTIVADGGFSIAGLMAETPPAKRR